MLWVKLLMKKTSNLELLYDVIMNLKNKFPVVEKMYLILYTFLEISMTLLWVLVQWE